jgi:polyvinyl alcohol dehydrogenase (cytochrome)
MVLSAALLGSLLVAGGSASAAGCGTAGAGGDWPSYGRDLSNSRHQALESTIGPGNVASLQSAWSVSAVTIENMRSTPVLADGCLFVTSFGPGVGLGPSLTGSVIAIDAGTGQEVWRARLVVPPALLPGMFAPAVADGVVYVAVSSLVSPYVIALDEATGAELWTAYLYEGVFDPEVVTGIQASMVVFDGMLFVPFTGADAIGLSHPSFYILDAKDGKILKKTVVIPQEYWWANQAGGAMWGTAVVDMRNKYLYVGTANPYNKRQEHAHTDSILKIDVDRERYTSFGEIVGNYKGENDYDEAAYNSMECKYLAELVLVGFSTFCGQKDIDFGASPNLFTTSDGRLLVGDLQKSCTYHAVDAATMRRVWAATGLGQGGASGCASTSAVDETTVYVTVNGGLMYAFDKDTGAQRWRTEFNDVGARYQPVSVANGVVYTLGNNAHLLAFDAATGSVLFDSQLTSPSGAKCEATAGAGVTVARNTIFATCDTSAIEGVPALLTEGLFTGPQPGAVFAYRL